MDWWTTLQFLTCVHDIVGLKKNGVEGDILITRVTFVTFFCGMREVARWCERLGYSSLVADLAVQGSHCGDCLPLHKCTIYLSWHRAGQTMF